ncbi:MAG: hypothetical protein K8T91_19495 [Planctomycetes bacterium]|nr:hypothetical protein [Planctomycetota bacterium]
MNQRRNEVENPYVSPRDAGRSSARPLPFQPAPKALWYNITAIVYFVGAFVVIHSLSMENRERVLIWTAFGLIPVSIVLSCLPRPLHYWGIFVSVFAQWLALVYCGDMGGPYAHSLTAGLVSLAGLAALVPSSIIVLIRGFVYRKRKRAFLVADHPQ